MRKKIKDEKFMYMHDGQFCAIEKTQTGQKAYDPRTARIVK